MLSSNIRERSLCLLNCDHLDPPIQPWSTMSDAQFHPDVSALFCNANVNPIQSIQTNYLPPFISYLWPFVHHGVNLWAVDHPPLRDTTPIKFVLKYDLLIWNQFYRSSKTHPSINGDIVYPKVLILAPDWSTCENTYQHLSNVTTDVLKNVQMCCIYEGQNIESELYRKLLSQGCDLLIATPTIVQDLIQKRHIHFEQLQMIVYDQLDLLLQPIKPLEEILNLIQLHSNPNHSTQHFFLSRIVNQKSQDFLEKFFPKKISYLSSSLMETCTYQNILTYCEPCRNWFERKHIVKDALDLAHRCRKKVLMCAYQTRRLATMQSILNDLSIQSILIHSQLHQDEIREYIHEWQIITDRPVILLIQDDILHDTIIDNADIIIHLDVQRLIWYQLYNQRLKLIYKHLLDEKKNLPKIKRTELTSLKSIEKFYQNNPTTTVPLVIILWPGDCAQVTYDLIDYLQNSGSYLHPLIERLARNNCHESVQMKINVEFCPTLKMFGQCFNEKKLKRCPYRHHFHYDTDCLEQSIDINPDTLLSNAFELCLPNEGEIELSVTHVSDGNRLWGRILRWRNDVNQTLVKVFDYDVFDQQMEEGFNHVKHRPLSEIVQGEIYFYSDQNKKIHRVYVCEQEQTFFDIRRADSILNRLLKASNTTTTVTTTTTAENEEETKNEQSSTQTTFDRPALTVFSLDTGITFTLKSNEHLYSIEPASLKQYPPLATEIILCHVYPLDQITMTFTKFAVETLRSLTLNEIFMGRIKLATRSCFWIDPLVRPVRLAALKRIAYDKPIRKQLILSKLIQSNDNHMHTLDRLAVGSKLKDLPMVDQEEKEVKTESHDQEAPAKQPTESNESEEANAEFVPIFKPFLNRMGQLIINPVGRSKEFFAKHHQQFRSDLVKPLTSVTDQISSFPKDESLSIHRSDSLGHGHSNNTETVPVRPPSLSLANGVTSQHSSHRTLVNPSNVTTPSEVGPSKMNQEEEEEDIFEDTTDELPDTESIDPPKSEVKEETRADDEDQMTFIFGPKLFSQFRQIKDMEDEQRRQADFPVQRNRHRPMRNNNPKPTNTEPHENDENNESTDAPIHPPNMSRYEPFVGERGPLTQEQIAYKQTQRKTRLFWEQTSRDIYLTIGFYNVDSTQTRVSFEKNEVYCRTKIRTYDRYVRIHLAHEILPEKSSFQVRRSNILVTMRKQNEAFMWATLTNRPLEPRPEFFTVDYGSDDESDTEKRRRTLNRQWEQIREEKRKTKRDNNNDDEKFLLDEIDDDDQQQQQPTEKFNSSNHEEDAELTETSSDSHSTDSDDCYYEDQVPRNHIPKGYNDADDDHRFYGQQLRS